mmetsp:Transcript_113310/g.353224  ORF Transcript_113310/g.353224 Transcript_113310/m.353224 type:complete len:267 (+) Transcript_113310:747-1547(+)
MAARHVRDRPQERSRLARLAVLPRDPASGVQAVRCHLPRGQVHQPIRRVAPRVGRHLRGHVKGAPGVRGGVGPDTELRCQERRRGARGGRDDGKRPQPRQQEGEGGDDRPRRHDLHFLRGAGVGAAAGLAGDQVQPHPRVPGPGGSHRGRRQQRRASQAPVQSRRSGCGVGGRDDGGADMRQGALRAGDDVPAQGPGGPEGPEDRHLRGRAWRHRRLGHPGGRDGGDRGRGLRPGQGEGRPGTTRVELHDRVRGCWPLHDERRGRG